MHILTSLLFPTSFFILSSLPLSLLCFVPTHFLSLYISHFTAPVPPESEDQSQSAEALARADNARVSRVLACVTQAVILLAGCSRSTEFSEETALFCLSLAPDSDQSSVPTNQDAGTESEETDEKQRRERKERREREEKENKEKEEKERKDRERVLAGCLNRLAELVAFVRVRDELRRAIHALQFGKQTSAAQTQVRHDRLSA